MKEMYDLVQVGERTYYIYCPTNMGIYLRKNGKAVVFDSGNSSNVGKTIARILESQGWELDCIINTHAHADHISGNAYLQKRYGCPIFASDLERAFIENTSLLPSVIYGGNPPQNLLNPAIYAKPSVVFPFTHENFPKELEIVDLKGHSPGHIGIRTTDDIVYVGDAYVGAEILSKYHVSFIYNIKDYLNSLDQLESLEAAFFIPAHDTPQEDISAIIQINKDKTIEILNVVEELCTGITLEEIFQGLTAHYNNHLTFSQHFLNTHTLKGYLTYLLDEKRIEGKHKDGSLLWGKI